MGDLSPLTLRRDPPAFASPPSLTTAAGNQEAARGAYRPACPGTALSGVPLCVCERAGGEEEEEKGGRKLLRLFWRLHSHPRPEGGNSAIRCHITVPPCAHTHLLIPGPSLWTATASQITHLHTLAKLTLGARQALLPFPSPAS